MKSFWTVIKITILYVSVTLLFPVTGLSQEEGSCAEKLKMAQALFEKGQVEQVAVLLNSCLKSGFSREESLEAYKLLIQSYIFEDKLEKADSAMLAFLRINPEYQLSPTDHSSFVRLFNDFVVNPVIQVSFHFGTNVPFLTFIDPVSTAGAPTRSYYTVKPVNLFISLELKFELNKRLELNFEPAYSQLGFTNVEDYMGIDNLLSKIKYTESQRRVELPVSITYNIRSYGKFTPYARLGFGPAFSLGSTATAESRSFYFNGTNITGSDINRKDSRIAMDIFTQVGSGLKYKTRGGFLFGEIRSDLGILEQTITGQKSSEELANPYKYADDHFHANTLNISIGYTMIFYKPTKK